ncbi:MAG: hypothetical protein M3277_09100 [Actinomycetota bacterium]|nr:hypothetical protein [Actinomycetota bacterium]
MILVLSFVGCTETRDPAGKTADKPLWLRSTAEPYPFITPIPPLAATELDGRYTRSVSAAVAGESVKCRRCAPYRIEVGTTTLVLTKGRYFVTHEAPGKPDSSQFASRGHFTVDGRRLTLFNDANCPAMRGMYEWRLDGALRLEAVEDECPFSLLRARFLELTSWDQHD